MDKKSSIERINDDLNNQGLLKKYGDNALLLYALTLKFRDLDIEAASEYLTDGADDKKIDLVYVNIDEQVAIVAQSYFSSNPSKKSAKANKASDLSSGMSWLLQANEEELPSTIQAAAHQLRNAIKHGDIKQLQIWYVHNLPESQEVKDELDSVVRSTNAILYSDYKDQLNNLGVNALEVGQTSLARWYDDAHNKIGVTGTFKITVATGGFEFKKSKSKWKTFMTTIPLDFLYDKYSEYHDSLFSANVREYLGSRRGSSNINSGIKDSVEQNPEDFLIYNNGITILTNNYSYDSKAKELSLDGISIINGAQTTGAIGSVANRPSEGSIFTRIVQIDDPSILDNVIEFNNKQNAMNPADFRSNDQIQQRLRDEFNQTNIADYSGGRRGGNGDAIKRNQKLLNSNTVAQVLTSFMGNPITAYQSIKKIWESNSNYWMIFNDSTNRDNILYAYTLYVAIQNLKQDFLSRSTSTLSNNSFTKTDSEALDLLRIRGAIWLIISATSAILPDILSDKVSNKQFIHFKRLSSIDEGADLWKPLIEAILPLAVSSFSQVLKDGLNNKMTTGKAISDFTRNFKGLIKLLPEQSSLEPLVNNTSTERPKQNSITSK